MAATPLPAVTILADDLTGACDTGCLFAGAGPVAVTVPGVLEAHDRAVLAVDTETRMLPDAETDADLASLAAAALAVPGTLAAGSAGLGRALSHALGLIGPAVALPAGAARLVVVGSLHPASRAQLDALARTGAAVVTVDARGEGDVDAAIAALGRGAPAVVASRSAPAPREPMA